ncbi:LytR cell envelope-related transcriptional attenuator [Pseudarthrobacter equi]|uniref:LytR cell envelope-related transcriptional attenuator n=1 Tax=Pseudarthrobacter equi TaxID=728066 RepID=A0A1H1W3C0_9MICC|nr:LytR C-terminal domain-containing protein [Pseudarthrobacter equi]SDS91574.1 LytR cell envelope-related transcriptional attenuator [Pseudarthrobacter equi]
MTKYARDEFDKVPETASRQGVHRTATAPSRVRLWPILAVGIAALAIGLVSFLILPKLGLGGTESQASAVVSEAPLADTGATPSAAADKASEPSATAQPSTDPSAESTTEPEPGPSATESAGPELDKTQPVAVYNAAGTSGLASRVGGTVKAAGWTLGQVGNWAGAPQQGSTVYYSGADQAANARELANLLGVPTVVASTDFQVPLVVVLGPGYR